MGLDVERQDDGSYLVTLEPEVRQVLQAIVEQFSQSIHPDSPQAKRLFPTAYPHDQAQEESYKLLGHSQILDTKSANQKIFHNSVFSDTLAEDEVHAWMCCINDVRLLLGTELDVSEDTAADYENPMYMLYDDLSCLLELFVTARSQKFK